MRYDQYVVISTLVACGVGLVVVRLFLRFDQADSDANTSSRSTTHRPPTDISVSTRFPRINADTNKIDEKTEEGKSRASHAKSHPSGMATRSFMCRLICLSAAHAYRNTLVGYDGLENTSTYRSRAKNPVLGDVVVEISSLANAEKSGDWSRQVGTLLRIENWSGREIYVIRDMNGNETTWDNCQFVAVPSNAPGSPDPFETLDVV